MFLLMANLLVFALLMYFFYTQVFIPIQRGTCFFPMFRREAVLRDELRSAKQGTVEKHLAEEVKNERRRK